LSAKRFIGLFVAVNGGYLGQASEVLGGLLVCWLEVFAVAAPWGVEFDDLEALEGAGRFVEGTYGSVVGLGNQTIVVLAINLNDWRALRVEASVDRQSCQKSCCCNGDSSGVDHLFDFVDCVTTGEAVAAGGEINA
jgi:hypothetical protein